MTRAGGGVRLGVGATIVALALAGLAAQPWVRQGTVPRAPASAGGATATRAERASVGDATAAVFARPAPEATENAPAGAAEHGDARAEGADGPGRPPEIRLPAELEPVAPDVVVALTAPDPGQGVVSHAHVTDGADAAPGPAVAPEQGAMATGDGTGQSVTGPEPGAVYWFGPGGLQKVLVLTEEPR